MPYCTSTSVITSLSHGYQNLGITDWGKLRTKLLLLFGLPPFPSSRITRAFPSKTAFEEANSVDLRIECL